MNGPTPSSPRRRRLVRGALGAGLAVLAGWSVVLLHARAPEVALPTNAAPAKAAAEAAGDTNGAAAAVDTNASVATATVPDAGQPGAKAPSEKPDKKPAGPGVNVPPKEIYLSIVKRNPFGLKEPPPPKQPEPEPKKEEVKPSALKLSGISTLLGGKHAMFVLQEPGKKNVYSGLVAEGDTDTMIASLQVVSIDPKAGSVRVNYGGKQLLLDFENNGLKPPKAAAAKTRTRTVAGRTVTRPSSSGRTTLTRPSTSRTSSTTSTGIRRVGSTRYTAPSIRRNPSVPARTVRGGSVSANRNAPRRVSPAEQVIIMRAQKQQAEAAGIPMPPTPPIPGIDIPESGSGGGALPPTPGGGPPMPPIPGR